MKRGKKYWKKLYKEAEKENGRLWEALRDTGYSLIEAADKTHQYKSALEIAETQAAKYLQENHRLRNRVNDLENNLPDTDDKQETKEASVVATDTRRSDIHLHFGMSND